MRTQTLVKNAIIQVDANPFKQWYQQHYGAEIGAKKRSAAAQAAAAETAVEEKSASNHVKRKLAVRAGHLSRAACAVCISSLCPPPFTSAVSYGLGHGLLIQQCSSGAASALNAVILCAHCAGVQVRTKGHVVDTALDEQFATGRLYACIASRPGQCGRCDGYILEGKELEFYVSGCCATSFGRLSYSELLLCSPLFERGRAVVNGCRATCAKRQSCCIRLSMQPLVDCQWRLRGCNDVTHLLPTLLASCESCMTCIWF